MENAVTTYSHGIQRHTTPGILKHIEIDKPTLHVLIAKVLGPNMTCLST